MMILYYHLDTVSFPAVTVIGFTQKSVTVNEDDMSATLTVRIISGPLATGDWAELEFITSDMPSSNTSAVCKY